MRNLPGFDGSIDIRPWLRKFEAAARLERYDDEQKIAAIQLLFTASAELWLDQWITQQGALPMNDHEEGDASWGELREALLNNFSETGVSKSGFRFYGSASLCDVNL